MIYVIVSLELNEFQKITNEFIKVSEKFAKEVDTHKMMAIGVKNLLKTISKQRQTEQRDLQVNKNLIKILILYLCLKILMCRRKFRNVKWNWIGLRLSTITYKELYRSSKK